MKSSLTLDAKISPDSSLVEEGPIGVISEKPISHGRPVTSEVWKHFQLNEVNNEVTCEHCKHSISYAGSTSNMTKHLKRNHPEELKARTGSDAGGINPFIKQKPDFICDLCGTVTQYRVRHMAAKHGIFLLGKHTCKVCGKLHCTKSDLYNHMKSHEDTTFIW